MNNPASNQWISVNDRLPEHGSMVLICFGENRMMAIARYFMTIERRWLDACYGREEYAPDFWQPLPEPPPKYDPFEEWWSNQLILRFQKSATATNLIAHREAKQVWDAAIKSLSL